MYESNEWETSALTRAVTQCAATITDQMLVDWKRSNGPISCREMASERKRRMFVKWARTICASVGK